MTRPPGLQAIRERAEKATPEPWVADNALPGWFLKQPHAGYRIVAECPVKCRNGMEHHPHYDYLFMAAARTDVPALLDLIDTLAEALHEIEGCGYKNDPCKVCHHFAFDALKAYEEFGQ